MFDFLVLNLDLPRILKFFVSAKDFWESVKRLNPCNNKGLGKMIGKCYFRSFNAFYHRENLHLILSRTFSCFEVGGGGKGKKAKITKSVVLQQIFI